MEHPWNPGTVTPESSDSNLSPTATSKNSIHGTRKPGPTTSARPGPALLPRLGPGPGRWPAISALLVLSAWIVALPASARPWSLIPGDPTHTDVGATISFHWLIHTVGLLGSMHSRLLGYPLAVDRVVMNGFPLDVLVSTPLVKALGMPAGYTLFYVFELWLLGMSMAWLAGRWWRSPQGAAVAGVVAQTAGVVTMELEQGRTAQVFGAALLPLALGFFARALLDGQRRDAVAAGIVTGLAMLSYWYFGWFFGLALGALIPLALLERRRALLPCLWAGLAAVLVIALPLAYTLRGLEEQTGMHVTMSTIVSRRGKDIRLAELVQGLGLTWKQLLGGEYSLRPIILLLCGLGAWKARARRLAAPLLWMGVGTFSALGTWLFLPGSVRIPASFALTLNLPFLCRLLWPQRSLFLVAPAVALLAAGGTAALLRRFPRLALATWLLPVLVLTEAFALLPQLPLDSTEAAPSARAIAIGTGAGPALVLPSSSGYLRDDALILVDQVQHGRPLANWTMHPSDTNAPKAFRDFVSHGELGYLYNCEIDKNISPDDFPWSSGPSLAQIGIRDVYLDVDFLEDLGARGRAYVTCVARLLGEPRESSGPYQHHPVEPQGSHSEDSPQ